MNVSPQLLAYNALAVCFYITPHINVTITCSIQPTSVTIAMEVLHNSCNMCTCDLPDMHAHVTTIS